MEPEVIEPDYVEFLPHGRRPEEARAGQKLFHSSHPSCCWGCCLFEILAFLWFASTIGNLAVSVLVLAVASWATVLAMKTMGVSRFSPWYAYAVVPVFLVIANFLALWIRGHAPYTWTEVAVGIAAIYILLWLMDRARIR